MILGPALISLGQNASTLVIGVLLYCWLRERSRLWAAWRRALADGIVFGALTILSMSMPLWAEAGLRIDCRAAIVGLAVYFSGPLAGLMVATIAGFYRLWLGGPGAPAGIFVVGLIFALSLMLRSAPARRGSVDYRDLSVLGGVAGVCSLAGPFILPQQVVAWDVIRDVGLALMVVSAVATLGLGALIIRSDRGRALERQIAESERRFRAVIDNLPTTIAIRDRTGRYVLVNQTLERLTRISAADILERTREELWTEYGVAIESDFDEKVAASGEAMTVGPIARDKNGKRHWLMITTFPIPNASGEIDQTGTVTAEVTELWEARERLRGREETLKRHHDALVSFMTEGAFQRPLGETMRAITEIAGTAMQVEFATIYHHDGEADRTRCLDRWTASLRRHSIEQDFRISDFPGVTRAFDRDRVLVIDIDDPRIAAAREPFSRDGMVTGILAGIYLDGRLQGHVGFAETSRQRRWTSEEVAFARSVADLVALALLTIRHRETLAALDLVDQALFVERADGSVIYANAAALSLSEGTAPPPRLPAAFRGERAVEEVRSRADGPHGRPARDFELRRARLPDGGMVTIAEDITEKKAASRERERLQGQLEQSSKMEAVGQLAGGIAHDFNNLLGAILSFARFLEEDLPKGSQERGFAQRILSAGQRGKALVAQILSFAKARNVDRTELDLRAVAEESRALLGGSLLATTRIEMDLPAEPMLVSANDAQLTQVVVNLLINAHDALGGQPGRIALRLGTVMPGDDDHARVDEAASGAHGRLALGRLDPRTRYARLTIADSGAGIPPDILPRIFEPFFTTKDRSRGTGLGLAVVHGIITALGGACLVEAAPTRGTSVSIYLPLVETAGLRAKTESEASPGLRGRERVLVVDDESDLTDTLAIGLDRLGYEVATVNDPAEALETIADDPSAWDVLVTDQIMAGMKGLTLIGKVREIRPDITVILCTGLDDGLIERSAAEAGVDAYLAKPIEASQIAECIRRSRRAAA